MYRNGKFLKLFLIVTITLITLIGCFENNTEEDEYEIVDWIPSNKDIAGTYLLDRSHHPDLPKDSAYLKFRENNFFTAKNFFYSEFGSDSLKPIQFAEGKWTIEKNAGINSSIKINLVFSEKYNKYNGIDKFKNKKNAFLEIIEIQMSKKDSSYLLSIFIGDPDHSKNRYYYYQQK
jgi:hypothetical protein